MNNNRPIGVLDSGIGGLTVVREIIKYLPGEDIVYIGDTARVPWGTRSKETIITFSLQLANFLSRQKVKLIVLACHTASSIALSTLRKKIKTPLMGVIKPSVTPILSKTKNRRVGIIGTPATIKSNAWEKALKKKRRQTTVFSAPCPLFVPLVEEGLFHHQITRIIAKEYLQPLLEKRIDTLVLACTHYPLLKGVIRETVGKQIALINPGKTTAQALSQQLRDKQLLSSRKEGNIKIYFTDSDLPDTKKLEKYLGKRIYHSKIKQIYLDKI